MISNYRLQEKEKFSKVLLRVSIRMSRSIIAAYQNSSEICLQTRLNFFRQRNLLNFEAQKCKLMLLQFSIMECSKQDNDVAFCSKGLSYRFAKNITFVLNLLYKPVSFKMNTVKFGSTSAGHVVQNSSNKSASQQQSIRSWRCSS